MLVTLPGIVIFVSPSQLTNAHSPILVTLFGIMILVRLSHCLNASFPMLITLSGIIISENLQPANAEFPMLVILFGILVELHPDIKQFVAVSTMALHPLRLSYFAFPDSTTSLFSALQLLKIVPVRLVTLRGIVTLVRLLQPLNAYSPIFVTVSGIVILVSP